MQGRESKAHNDLFFICSLIEYMGRLSKNRNRVVVNALGEKVLQKIYGLADVYHSENIEKIATEFLEEAGVENGTFDITNVKYDVPTFWDMGKVYKRLIIKVSGDHSEDYIRTLILVYNSWISERIDNYNSSFYYSSPDYIYQSYLYGEALDM